VAVEITPEPSEEERRAILRALEQELEEADEPSRWRRAALTESERAAAHPGRSVRIERVP
jgi:hypothetical protein